MLRTLALLSLLLVAACTTTGPKPSTGPNPGTGPYASMDCTQLEAERIRLVAELDALSAGDDVGIDRTRSAIDGVGAVQVEKGCAG